jgi:hypothetical protein
MAIIPEDYDFEIPARDNVLISLAEEIWHAMTCGEPIKAADLARDILDEVEQAINSVADDGTVIYRV